MRKNVKKTTRATALALSSMLLLGACGQAADEKTQVSSDAKESSSKVESSATEETTVKPYWEMLTEVSDTSELPDWTGDTLEINTWFAASTGAGLDPFSAYPETEVTWKEFERVTGVKINWEECIDNGGQNIDAKMPMVIASGDLPNVIFGYNINSQIRTLFDEGYLADLTEYYENGDLDQVTYWLPTEQYSFVYNNMRTEEGAFYGIPYGANNNGNTMAQLYAKAGYSVAEYDADHFNVYGKTPADATGKTTSTAIWVRDDILNALYPEALTMDEIEQIYVESGTFTEEQIYDVSITNMEEFQQLLRDVKELTDSGEYVGKDGKPIEVIYGPHTETDNWYWGVFMPAFVAGFGNNTDYFSYVDLTAEDPSQMVRRSIDSDLFVDYFRSMNELLREGILAKDSLLDNKSMFNEKVNNHHYAFTYVNAMFGEWGSGDGYRYRPLWIDVPLTDEVTSTASVSTDMQIGIFKDTLSDEEIDQLIHAINYLNSVVGTNNFYWGPASAGLFTEDADGHRSYVDEALYNSMILREDNGEFRKYGLYGDNTATYFNNTIFWGLGAGLLKPEYLEQEYMDRQAVNAHKYYNPGVLPGNSVEENSLYVTESSAIWNGFGQKNEDIITFWTARPGYEDQLKKVLASETEEAFNENLEELIAYADDNNLTAEVMAQFSLDWAEANRADLELAGYLD